MRKTLTVLFYPEVLDNKKRFSRLYRILLENPHIKYHNDPSRPHDVHIFWSYTPHSITPDHITLDSSYVINRGCWNIGKQKVNDIFNDISVDPLTHEGLCVEKIDKQGRHEHHGLVQCPVTPKDGYVYQKYLAYKEGEAYIRYRVYYAGRITHVVKFYQTDPFKTAIIKTEQVEKRSLFTPGQEEDFCRKCNDFGFDLGEADVLWDGKPVVIDINNVSTGKFIKNYTDMPFTKEIDKTIKNYLHDTASKV